MTYFGADPVDALYFGADLVDAAYIGADQFWPSAGPGPFITDTFTGSDGTTLNGRSTDTGGKTWTNVRGGWTIQSNKAAPTAVSPPAILSMDPGVADKDITINITPQAASIDGLMLRYIDLSNYWRLDIDVTGDQIRLISATGGAETTRGTSGSFTLTAGSTYAVRAVMDGNFITIHFDGVQRLQTNNSTHVAATTMGLIAFNTATRFDDLAVANWP